MLQCICTYYEKNWKYLIRVKDKESNGITQALDLPKTDEFDTTVTVQLSRSNSKRAKASLPFHKFVPWSSQFDYLDNPLNHYSMTFRILRFRISEDTYRMVFTNLSADEFSFEKGCVHPPGNLCAINHVQFL